MLGWMIRHGIRVEDCCEKLQKMLDSTSVEPKDIEMRNSAAKIAFNIGVDALDERPSDVELQIVGRQ